jgi:hypothetical protein
VTLKQTSSGRVRISTTQVSHDKDLQDFLEDAEEEERLRDERLRKRTIRIATLYGMNSTAKIPMSTRKNRAKSAQRKAKLLQKKIREEAQEKENHKYSYSSMHDSTKFIKGAQSFEMLTNVEGSPRDPKAAQRAARDDRLSGRTWKMGYTNAISTRPISGKKLEIDENGRAKEVPKLGKGWPFDTSMNRPDLVRGPEPWQPPLGNKFPKDWPKGEYDEESPRGMHYPWSPPRRPSSAQDPLIGTPENVFSKGRRASKMSTMPPPRFFQQKQEGRIGKFHAGSSRGNSASSTRRLIRSATHTGRLSHPSTASSERRPPTAASTISTSRRVQFNAESPMRGKLRPRTAMLKERSNNIRPSTADRFPSPSPQGKLKSRPQSAMPKVRPQTAVRKNRANRRAKSAKPILGSSPAPATSLRSSEQRRSHSAGHATPVSGIATLKETFRDTYSPSPKKGVLRRSASAGANFFGGNHAPHHLRPTTATKTKRKYRVGLWPSGRWKYEYGENVTHHQTAKKGMKKKNDADDPSDSDDDGGSGSDTESVDDNGETASQRYKRRNRDAKKRPMVAGQKKKKKLFESSSLATYTVMRSAPLKKHHMEEMLQARGKEEIKRVNLRNEACSWLLHHPRFKKMPMVRLWKKFVPIAIDNIAESKKDQKGNNPGLFRRRSVPFGAVPSHPTRRNSSNDLDVDEIPVVEKEVQTIQTVDEEPWRSEHLEHHNMWVSRPQFIYNMRVLMGLNETQKNLRELNKMFSSFDIKVEDQMNIREFCFVFVELREEKKRAVFGGMPDVSRFYDEAKTIFKDEYA